MPACTCKLDRFSRCFPASLSSPAAARRFCLHALARNGLGHLGEVAQLLVSELVTNAVVHAASRVTVRVECGDSRVRIAVADRSSELPVLSAPLSAPPPEAEGGRGMFLVDLLASRWGVDTDGEGKTVWFELDV